MLGELERSQSHLLEFPVKGCKTSRDARRQEMAPTCATSLRSLIDCHGITARADQPGGSCRSSRYFATAPRLAVSLRV